MSSSDEPALISQLCGITNTDTPSGRVSASHLLRSNGWSLEAALNDHYSGGASSASEVTERERELGVTAGGSSDGSTTRRTVSPSHVMGKDARPHVSRVGLSTSGTGGSGIFWPIKMILRIVTSLWYFLVRSIIPLSFLPHLPRFLLPPSHTTPRSLSTQYHASPIQQCLSHIHSIESETGRSTKDGTLPAFWVGGYKEFLRGLKEEGKVGCVVVGSGEHEDDGVFKSEVLGDAEFIKCLKENDISIWACDIRYQEGYQVSQTLQITTYPSILFFSLLPSSTSPTPASSSSRNKLTILLTLSGPPTSTTSASSLIQAITTSIVPRTRSYLSRLRRERYTAEETRRLREEQDRAVAESERKDRERMKKARKEVEERERMKVVEAARKEREEREKKDKTQRREKMRKERLEWRRWMRRSLGPDVEKGFRVMVRLPNGVGGRAVRVFPTDAEDVGLLFSWVETLLIPVECKTEDDPTEPPSGRTRWEEEDGGEVVKLFTSYPRREVENTAGKEMWSVVKDGGGSLVCEVVGDEDESDEEEEE